MPSFRITPSLLSIFFFPSAIFSQLTPSPTYLPVPSSSGTVVSSNPSIPNNQWSTLLANTLYFYDCQRSGDLGPDNRVPWRNNSGLQDGADVGLDLTGGFYDAGNYLKVTFPFSWTISSISWSGIDFGTGFSLSNQSAYLDSNLRWGFDWLIKAHPSDNTLFVQIGLNDVDDNYWGGDQGIPTPRPSLQINQSAPGTDCAASTAGAFAAGAFLYGGGKSFINDSWTSTDLENQTYSSILLSHAESLYAFATNTTPYTEYSTTLPVTGDDYGSSGFADDLVWGALWLYLATNNTAYYNDATNYFSKYSLSGQNQVLNWDSKIPAVYLLFYFIAEKYGMGDVGTWQSEVESYFDWMMTIGTSQKTSSDGVQAFLTDGGLLYYPGDSNDASLNPAMNAAQLLIRYHSFATTSQKASRYLSFANQQINYALGQNPMNVPYVVGQHPNSPINPHSAPASGGDDIGDINNVPPVEAYVIYGGAVGGPDDKDRFWDIRSDWPETEIALDYNAPFVALASYNVINNSSDPFYVAMTASKVTPPGQPTDEAFPGGGSSGLSTGAIVAIVVVAVVVVAIAALAVWKRDRIRVRYRQVKMNKLSH